MSTLGAQQAALVRALVARGDIPAGFDEKRVDATINALLRKRADEVARVWPALLATREARSQFREWADGRPKTTSFDDGLAFALVQAERGELSRAAAAELDHNRPRRRWRRAISGPRVGGVWTRRGSRVPAAQTASSSAH